MSRYRVLKCGNCGLEFTLPHPSPKVLRDFYHDYVDPLATTEVLRQNAVRNLERLDLFGVNSKSRILDFGAGRGIFGEIAGERCTSFDFARDSLPTTGQWVADLKHLEARKIDVVTLWGVLEHLPDPIETIKSIQGVVSGKFLLVMTTVNAESDIPYRYKPPEHLTYWTSQAVEVMFSRLGGQVIEISEYRMIQQTRVYLERVLARSEKLIREGVTFRDLPEFVEIPTNEWWIVGWLPPS